MTKADAYYRALVQYYAKLGEKHECMRDSITFAETDGVEDIKVTRAHCTVDEEWIKAIEEGLVFIEKAIKEERQFIFSEGEVIPIEKVKHVSKDSVRHLARHAELITREQEGEDLIPDKLYTVEKINDYNVYENRFLYMLLCYLRDFVSLRYRNILDLTNRYDGTLKVNKEVAVFGRTLSISIDMHDEHRDDAYLREHNPEKELIDRMDLILKTILSFLATPLMESAAKAPMLKPPITKTNVLKMDNNFKGAVKLYEYIIAYEGDGYTVEQNVRELSPFRDAIAEEMAQIELLMAFVVYEHGLDIKEDLRSSAELDAAAEREAELKKKTEQMEAIRRRIEKSGEPVESYILELEKHLRALQKELDRMEPLYAEVEELKATERVLTAEKAELATHIDRLEAENRDQREAHQLQVAQLEQEHAQETMKLQLAHSGEIADINQKNAETVAAVKAERDEEIAKAKQETREAREETSRVLEESRAISEKNTYLSARLHALRHIGKDITDAEKDELTSQENFDELERELEAFVEFYKSQWSLTKRKIRKDLLNLNYIKGQSGKK